MSRYRRVRIRGATYFFTVVTQRRRRVFADHASARMLGHAIREVRERLPFHMDAIVLLPDHFHCLMRLPPGDHDYSTRMQRIKAEFTKAYLRGGGVETLVTDASAKEGRRGVWQRRFWEHTIRDEDDFERHADYIHYNPVKHGYVTCPHQWRWSTFARNVKREWYRSTWCCRCGGNEAIVPEWAMRMPESTGE